MNKKYAKSFYLTSTVALALLRVTNIYAENYIISKDGVDVLVNQSVTTKILSSTQLLNAKAFKNPFTPPDTSDVVPDHFETPEVKGVMTKDGPDFFTDYATKAYGTFGIPYTTTRVQDGNGPATATVANRLSTTYPYRAIGKLTFTANGWTSYCSASVIRRGVIVTAAHCIQDFGSGNTMFSNWQFWPGYYGATGATTAQQAPYGTWTWQTVTRPTSWVNGTDTGGCGGAQNNDLAVIALRKNAAGKFIGDVVGKINYAWNNYGFVTSNKTGNLHTAAVSTFGYPALMDDGLIMQRTDGPTYTTTVCGAKQIMQGSNLTGGSSGGPWIVNFSGRNAALIGGAMIGTASNMAIIGVTSWGSEDPNTPKDNYSSQFAQNAQFPNASYGSYGSGNIGSLLNSLCSSTAPGGGTYASQGYCN